MLEVVLWDGDWSPLHKYFGSASLHGVVSSIDNVEIKLHDTSIRLTRRPFADDMDFYEDGIPRPDRSGEFPRDIEQC